MLDCRLIHGFVSKQQAQEWLMRSQSGTFLLRFSDSELGGITIAWVAEDAKGTEWLLLLFPLPPTTSPALTCLNKTLMMMKMMMEDNNNNNTMDDIDNMNDEFLFCFFFLLQSYHLYINL